jgi:predicted phosphodiesterase
MSITIQIASDLHLEHLPAVPYHKLQPADEASILVLAGDIGRPGSRLYNELLEWVSAKFEYVLIVLGNHECYGTSVENALHTLKYSAQRYTNIHILYRAVWVHPCETIVFAGAILWTDIDERAYRAMSDRRSIYVHNTTETLCRDDFLNLHREDIAFFEKSLVTYAGLSLVCISHHPPLMAMNGVYDGGELATGFCTALNRLFQPPLVAWICGHTHQSVSIKENNITCISNCLGYKSELGLTGYRNNVTIEISIPSMN